MACTWLLQNSFYNLIPKAIVCRGEAFGRLSHYEYLAIMNGYALMESSRWKGELS